VRNYELQGFLSRVATLIRRNLTEHDCSAAILLRVAVAAFGIASESVLPRTSMAQANQQEIESSRVAPLRTTTFTTTEGTWMAVAVSPDGKMLAFDMVGNIFLLPITGGRARQLTDGPAYNEYPAFSPDGRFVVFTSDRGGRNELWRVPVAGGTPTLFGAALATNGGTDTAMYRLAPELGNDRRDTALTITRSPDGRFEIRSSDALQRSKAHGFCPLAYFLLRDRQTGAERRLAPAGSDCGGIMPPSAFTPDAKAFITAHSGKLWRIAVPSGEMTEIPFRADVRLTYRPQHVFPRPVSQDSLVHARRIANAMLAPDGSALAFSALYHIWVQPLPSGTPRRLTTLTGVSEAFPTWSPDGRTIAFVTWSDERGEGHVYTIPADGSAPPRRLSRESGFYTALNYGAEGRSLYAVMRPPRSLRRTMRSDYSVTPVADAEVIRLPLDGTPPLTLDMGGGVDGDGGVPLTRLATLQSEPERVTRFVPLRQIGWPRSQDYSSIPAGAVVAIPTTHGPDRTMKATSDTLFKVVLYGRSAQKRAAPASILFDIVLSPQGNRALLVVNVNKLFIVDVPARVGNNPPTITFDPRVPENTPNLRLVTPLEAGAECPYWSVDGRFVMYSFGNKFFTYDVERGTTTAIAVNLTVPRDRPTGTLAFRNARLITMRGSEVIERGDLVIKDRRIVALGRSGTVTIPPDAHVVDASGTTIIPGFIDLHNHISPLEVLPRTRVWQFESNLAYGILTSRDPQVDNSTFMTYEDLIATGDLLGPRYANTGPGIGVGARDYITSLDEARKVIARYRDYYQVTYLKEYMNGRREARQWIVMAAAERQQNVTSHGNGSLKQVLQNALDGYAGIDHPFEFAPLYRDARQVIAITGITLTHLNWYLSGDFMPYYATKLTAEDWALLARLYQPNALGYLRGKDLKLGSPDRSQYPQWKMDTTITALAAEGARIGVASHGDIPGLAFHMELWAYGEGGMPRYELLRSATLRGAETLGMARDLGSLEVGKLGDILVLDKNPLDDIMHTRAIRAFVFNGRMRDATTLDEMWPRSQRLPPSWWMMNDEEIPKRHEH
jgi:hypothetical protein